MNALSSGGSGQLHCLIGSLVFTSKNFVSGFAALTFRFKETVRHKLYSVPAFTFSSFCIVLRKVPAVALWFSFFPCSKMNIWEIDHFAHFLTSFPFLVEDYFGFGQIKSAGNEDFITLFIVSFDDFLALQYYCLYLSP